MPETLLEVRDLSVSFETDDGWIRAVDSVDFTVRKGEVLGLVGESGCGKSVSALSTLRLVPQPPGRIDSGQAIFQGQDLLRLPLKRLRQVRGAEISMIFQEPMTALSPLHRIGRQLVETLRLHRDVDKAAAWAESLDWLQKVGIPDAEARLFAYPYELSGGMRQRVMIAMALMLHPALIIADEPTTALDVTIQAQVFDLMMAMKAEDTAILLITHDMGVVWDLCDRVVVMYASQVVERGDLKAVFRNPLHPYTRGLLAAVPRLTDRARRLPTIPGQVPAPEDYPVGCHFQDRCPFAFDRCRREPPPLYDLPDGRASRCFLATEIAATIPPDFLAGKAPAPTR